MAQQLQFPRGNALIFKALNVVPEFSNDDFDTFVNHKNRLYLNTPEFTIDSQKPNKNYYQNYFTGQNIVTQVDNVQSSITVTVVEALSDKIVVQQISEGKDNPILSAFKTNKQGKWIVKFKITTIGSYKMYINTADFMYESEPFCLIPFVGDETQLIVQYKDKRGFNRHTGLDFDLIETNGGINNLFRYIVFEDFQVESIVPQINKDDFEDSLGNSRQLTSSSFNQWQIHIFDIPYIQVEQIGDMVAHGIFRINGINFTFDSIDTPVLLSNQLFSVRITLNEIKENGYRNKNQNFDTQNFIIINEAGDFLIINDDDDKLQT